VTTASRSEGGQSRPPEGTSVGVQNLAGPRREVGEDRVTLPISIVPDAPPSIVPDPQGQSETDPAAQPGDLICPRCTYPNAEQRQYCRRCGLELHVVEEPTLGWWRRFVGWPHRHRIESLDDGGVPRAVMPLLTTILPVLLVVAAVVYVAAPSARKWVSRNTSRVSNDIRVLIAPHYALLRPIAVTASSAEVQEPASNAFDEVVGSPWVTNPTDGAGGVSQSITATFAPATSVNQIIFTIGTGVPATYDSDARMHQVGVTFTNSKGRTFSKVFTLNDTGNPQNVSMGGKNVLQVTVTILSVYPALTATPQSAGCATDEIEFFKKE